MASNQPPSPFLNVLIPTLLERALETLDLFSGIATHLRREPERHGLPSFFIDSGHRQEGEIHQSVNMWESTLFLRRKLLNH